MRHGIAFLLSLSAFSISAASAQQQPEMQAGATLMPLEPHQKEILFTEGEREGKRASLKLASYGKDWRLQLGNLVSAIVFRDEEGALRLREFTYHEEQSTTTFSPPILVIPGTISADYSFRQQSKVKVMDMETGEVDHQALIYHNLRSIKRRTFYTPGGSYQGFEVQFEQNGSFDLATVRSHFTGGFVENSGLVYAQLSYRIDKPLFFGGADTSIIELAEPLVQGQ